MLPPSQEVSQEVLPEELTFELSPEDDQELTREERRRGGVQGIGQCGGFSGQTVSREAGGRCTRH